jgi:hypothetical protein
MSPRAPLTVHGDILLCTRRAIVPNLAVVRTTAARHARERKRPWTAAPGLRRARPGGNQGEAGRSVGIAAGPMSLLSIAYATLHVPPDIGTNIELARQGNSNPCERQPIKLVTTTADRSRPHSNGTRLYRTAYRSRSWTPVPERLANSCSVRGRD